MWQVNSATNCGLTAGDYLTITSSKITVEIGPHKGLQWGTRSGGNATHRGMTGPLTIGTVQAGWEFNNGGVSASWSATDVVIWGVDSAENCDLSDLTESPENPDRLLITGSEIKVVDGPHKGLQWGTRSGDDATHTQGGKNMTAPLEFDGSGAQVDWEFNDGGVSGASWSATDIGG